MTSILGEVWVVKGSCDGALDRYEEHGLGTWRKCHPCCAIAKNLLKICEERISHFTNTAPK